MSELKRCSICMVHKPYSDFHANANSKDGHRSECKACRVAKGKSERKLLKETSNYKTVFEKYCPICCHTLPIECFPNNVTKKDGHADRCTTCHNATRRHKYANIETYKENIIKANKEYREKNPLRIAEASRTWRLNNPDYYNLKYANDPAYKEYRTASNKRWRLNNLEYCATKHKEYAIKNKDKLKEYNKQYRKKYRAVLTKRYCEDAEYRVRVLSTNLKRRRLEKNAVSTLTGKEWLSILELYNHACVYCGVTGIALTMDHVVPLSKGGDHTAFNVVPACRSCNSSKRANLPERLQMKIPILMEGEV